MPFLRGVQLTDTQRTQLHTLMQSARKDSQPIEQQLHTVHQQIEEALISTASINTAQLTSLQQQESSLRAQLDGNRLNTAIQARALLTTEQLAKAASVHQQLESLHAQERQLLGAGREFRPQAEPAQ
jgi:Spy/CpxP family protein refolding chaperone